MRQSIRASHASRLVAVLAAIALGGCGEEEPGQSAATGMKGPRSADLVQGDVCADPDVACAPTGAHGKHGKFACSVCHKVAGRLAFDKAGPAYAAGKPAPSFDAVAKTCSNVACHGVPSGTFTYFFPGGDGEPVQNTVTYGGSSATTPSWYASGGAGCTGCHGNPPSNYTWHGSHSGGNQCELCHADAVSVNGVATGLSTATNCGALKNQPCAALHANGALDVTAVFKSTCFGCH